VLPVKADSVEIHGLFARQYKANFIIAATTEAAYAIDPVGEASEITE
jgi:hypothetical protein